MQNLNLTFNFICAIAFLINIVAFAMFLGYSYIYQFAFFIFILLFIALLIISIIGRTTKNLKLKATFNLTCSIMNLVSSLILFGALGMLAIWSGLFIGLVLALSVFIAIDIIVIVTFGRNVAIPHNQIEENNKLDYKSE